MTLAKLIAAPLGLIAPETALRYLSAQARLSAASGYAAARRDGPNGRWLPRYGKADDMASRDARLIRARARAMVRDNPNLAGAIGKIIDNVVFTGIHPQAQLKKGETRNKLANDRIESAWHRWAAEVGLWELEQLCLRHLWMDGGCFVHVYPDEALLGRGIVPMGVELLDVDALNTSVHGPLPNGNICRYGAEYDAQGHLVAWHLWREALAGAGMPPAYAVPDPATRPSLYSSSLESIRLSAASCRLIMRRERIGQTLPVSWLHSCIMVMHDFDEYQNSERIAARIGAAFAVFLKQTDPTGAMGNGLDGQPLAGGTTTDGRVISMDNFIASGRLDMLPPGTDIVQAQNQRPSDNYEPFSRVALRGASAGTRMSYESYSNDYTGASYSSVRQAILEERRAYAVQQRFLAARLLAPVWDAFVTFRRAFGLGTEADVPVQWQFPGWSWIDPVKDATAAQIRMEMGVSTRHAICAEQGQDFEENIDALAEEARLMREAGLTLQPDDGRI